MRLFRREKAPAWALVSALGLASLAGPVGCSSPEPRDEKPKGPSDEVKALQAQVKELERQKKAAEDLATDHERESERVRRELDASRETATKSAAEARLSQEVLALQKKSYDAKIADLLARLKAAGAPDAAPVPEASASPQPGGVAPGEKVASTPARFTPIDLDVAVATVDGEPVSRREFVEALYYNYATQYIDNYLRIVLAAREAHRLGIIVSDADAEREVAESWATLLKNAKSEDKLNEQLAASGLTKAAVLSVLRANARTTATIRRLIVAERETPEGKERFEKKLHEWYDKNFGEKADARHLMIPVRAGTSEEGWKDVEKVAAEYRNQILAGTPWSEVAKAARERLKVQVQQTRTEYPRTAFSNDCSETERGPIIRAFFDSKIGELSEPVRWKGGVSLVLVEGRIPPKATFEAMRDSIEHDVREQQQQISQDDSDELFRVLWSRAKIEKHLELEH